MIDFISLITLNINALNTLIKRYWLAKGETVAYLPAAKET
jgi:hypothetical protein